MSHYFKYKALRVTLLEGLLSVSDSVREKADRSMPPSTRKPPSIITNLVYKAKLNCDVDLHHLASHLVNVRYQPGTFVGLIWHHRKIDKGCLLFRNGSIIISGCFSHEQAVVCIRRYARILQKRFQYDVRISHINLVTCSLLSDVGMQLDLDLIAVCYPNATYEPEIHNACFIKKGNICLSCFSSGQVVTTGIKKLNLINEVVTPILTDLTLFSI